MYSLTIASSVEEYRVTICESLLDVGGYDFVVADAYFEAVLSGKNILFIEANEANKQLSSVEKICQAFRDAGLTRGSKIAAIGGGIIQDLATLSCSLYMRGIKWDYFPTTLTGMMDSCLGGKSSINLGSVKNLIGNIYPPRQILIRPSFAETLPLTDKISGFCEAIKICFARGSEAFDGFLATTEKSDFRFHNKLDEQIFMALSAKKWFIETDEFDVKERQLLNFGHTFGHALEAATNFEITHGVAVGLGILAALNHPKSFQNDSTHRLKEYLFRTISPIGKDLDRIFTEVHWRIYEEALQSDKKNSRSALCHILPVAEGHLEKVFIPYSENAFQLARVAMQKTFDQVRYYRGN